MRKGKISLEGFFVKNPSNSLKTFTYFTTWLQKDKSFWGFKGSLVPLEFLLLYHY